MLSDEWEPVKRSMMAMEDRIRELETKNLILLEQNETLKRQHAIDGDALGKRLIKIENLQKELEYENVRWYRYVERWKGAIECLKETQKIAIDGLREQTDVLHGERDNAKASEAKIIVMMDEIVRERNILKAEIGNLKRFLKQYEWQFISEGDDYPYDEEICVMCLSRKSQGHTKDCKFTKTMLTFFIETTV